jgi:hypothetical protein
VPLRFTNPSPSSGWIEDFHFLAAEHAQHTLQAGFPAGLDALESASAGKIARPTLERLFHDEYFPKRH